MFSIISKKKKMLVGVLLFLVALLYACSQNELGELIDFRRSQYIITLSKTIQNKSILICIDNNGDVYQTIPFKGKGINSITLYQDKLYLYSSRENCHYILNDKNEWETFSYEKNRIEGSEDAASWFTTKSEHCLIETMNIGFYENHYKSAILYKYDGKQFVVPIDDLCLESAIEYNEKIYINASDAFGENGNVIVIVDRSTGHLIKVSFINDNTPASGQLLMINDKLYTYGSNASYLIASNEEKYRCSLGMMDTSSLEMKEIDYSNDQILLMYSFQNHLYVVTEKGKLQIYSEDLVLIEEKLPANMDVIEKYTSMHLIPSNRIVEHDDIIALLFLYDDLNPKKVGFIQEYQKKDLLPVRQIDITPPDVNEWIGELFDFTYIG